MYLTAETGFNGERFRPEQDRWTAAFSFVCLFFNWLCLDKARIAGFLLYVVLILS